LKQKLALKDKVLRKQINGKSNDIISADENKKKILILNLSLKTVKGQYIYTFTENSEVVLVFNVTMQV
jgi:hypothetical protein